MVAIPTPNPEIDEKERKREGRRKGRDHGNQRQRERRATKVTGKERRSDCHSGLNDMRA